MSADSGQQTIGEIAAEQGTTDDPRGDALDWRPDSREAWLAMRYDGPQAHLRDYRLDEDLGDVEDARGERERVCKLCEARVTLGTSGEEFGHSRDVVAQAGFEWRSCPFAIERGDRR